MKILSLFLFVAGLFATLVSDFIDNKLLLAFIFLLSQAFSCIFILIHQDKSLDVKDIRVVFVFCLLLYTIFYPLVVLLGFLYLPNYLVTVVYLFGTSFSGLYFAFLLFPAKLIYLKKIKKLKRFRFNPVIFNTIFFGIFILLLTIRGIPLLSASAELSRTEIFETHSQLWVVLMMIINASSIFILINFSRLNFLSKIVYISTTIFFIVIHAQMGNRRDYLPIILSMVCIYLFNKKVKINFKIIVISLVCFIFSFWISISRNANSVNLSNYDKVELAISSNEFIYPMQTLLFVIRDNYDYRLGQTYLFLPFQTLIPRAIYPSKPRGLGSELVIKSTGGGQGYAYTPSTEAYLNFGYIGPFIVFFIFGLLLVKLVKRLSTYNDLLKYVLFYSLIFDFMRGDFASFTYQLLIMMFIIEFYNLLQKKALK